LFTFDVRPENTTFHVKRFVDVSRLAVIVPLPVGFPVTDGSAAGVSVAEKFTIFEAGGDVESLPQAAKAMAAAASTRVMGFCIMSP
jgi:hypothetical protein